MSLTEDIDYVGGLLDSFAEGYHRVDVAAEDASDAGVPPEMQVGPVDDDGWVQWRVLPSTLSEEDVARVEEEFGARFPPLFRAYLLARFHLFNQVHSARYRQLVFMTDVPSGRRLDGLRDLIRSWRPLIDAGFLPFAQWGDGWGPMCFDLQRRDERGECPIVWIDHERLIPPGPELSRREAVSPSVEQLYGSCGEFLSDVFGTRAR